MDKPNDLRSPRQRARTKGREKFAPVLPDYDGSGITKREWMATQLLAGMLPRGGFLAGYEEDPLVQAAVSLAGKLLERLIETDGIDLLPPGEPVFENSGAFFVPSDLDAADMDGEDDEPDFDERDTEDLADTDEIPY